MMAKQLIVGGNASSVRIGLIALFLVFVVSFSGCIEDPAYSEASDRDKGIYNDAVRAGSVAECGRLDSANLKDKCLEKVAVKTGNSTVCKGIVDDLDSDYCYKGVAEKTQEPSLCEKIGDDWRKDKCYAEIAEKTDKPALCEKTSDQSVRNDCYKDVSYDSEDGSLCDKIKDDEGDKEECYSNLARNTKNIDFCIKIDARETQENCMHTLARVSKNHSVCNWIHTDEAKDTCLHDVAVYDTKKDDACRRIEDTTKGDDCFMAVAKYNHDYDSCDQIVIETFRQECIDKVSESCEHKRKYSPRNLPEDCREGALQDRYPVEDASKS